MCKTRPHQASVELFARPSVVAEHEFCQPENAMKAKTKTSPAKNSAKRNPAPDAIAMLKADHVKVDGMFKKYEKATGDKTKLAHEICKELIVHTELEEQIFYPACTAAGVEEDLMDEAQVEHDGAKVMIIELLGKQPDDEYYDAKVKVLSEYIKHHVKEEEKPGEGVFAKARKAKVDVEALGEKMATKKEELVAKYNPEKLPKPEFKSFQEAFEANIGKSAKNGKSGKGNDEEAPDPANDLTPMGEPRPWMKNKIARAAK